MATVAFSPGCMKNRCYSSSFIFAPRDWMTLRDHTQKRLSMTFHGVTRRNFAALEHSRRNMIHQKIGYTMHSLKKNYLHRAKPSIGRRWRTVASASHRTSFDASHVVAAKASHTFSNDNLSLDFWDVLLASLAVAAVSIGLIQSNPYGDYNNLLLVEAMVNDDSEALHNVGGESGRNMKADIEMTLHQPPTFNGSVKTVDAISTDSRVTYLSNNISSTKPYDISVRAIKGGRVTMEDEYFVADGGRFVAVFDGHGGGGVSQYLKNHLYDAVCNHVQIKHWEENDALLSRPTPNFNGTLCDTANVRGSSTEIPSVFSFAAALKSAFYEIEENVMKNDMLQFQGSTAVAVLIHEKYGDTSNSEMAGKKRKHRTLLSANVGDSRAVLSRNGRAVDLTRDHKPNDEQEKSRILAMGETIEWDRVSKVHRVRNLSLSRAIGDRYAKPVVSGEVEINHYPIIDQSDEFILLASDGLWDVMTSDEAVGFVHDKIQMELSSINIAKGDLANFTLVLRRNMAKFVAREAIRRGSSDNVCVVIVWLDDLG